LRRRREIALLCWPSCKWQKCLAVFEVVRGSAEPQAGLGHRHSADRIASTMGLILTTPPLLRLPVERSAALGLLTQQPQGYAHRSHAKLYTVKIITFGEEKWRTALLSKWKLSLHCLHAQGALAVGRHILCRPERASWQAASLTKSTVDAMSYGESRVGRPQPTCKCMTRGNQQTMSFIGGWRHEAIQQVSQSSDFASVLCPFPDHS
jgi:hypothetical protein